jgi:hypothetical protein
MEQGCEELGGSDVEVEQPLEAMQLPVLPILLDNDYLVEVLEVQLAEEEVEVEEENALLAEWAVVVVAWAMEQHCEELDRPDGEVEQPLVAMQLPVLPMNLAQEEVVEELRVQAAEGEVEVVGDFDVDDVDIEEALIQAEQSFVLLMQMGDGKVSEH